MEQKIFFTDLDDTLLDEHKELSSRNRAALNELLSEGHYASIITGRAAPSAFREAVHTGLDRKNCFVVCYNGAQIYAADTREMIFTRPVPMELVRLVFDKAHEFGISVQTYSRTHVVAERESRDLQIYCGIQKLPYLTPDRLEEVLTEPPAKVLILDYAHPERIEAFRGVIEEALEGRADVFRSSRYLLEVVAPGVNKGTAMTFLCERLGVPMENTVAAGDAENDLAMITTAHVGCAMCNGEEIVKQAADYVTSRDHNHSGAAEIIEKFVLGHEIDEP